MIANEKQNQLTKKKLQEFIEEKEKLEVRASGDMLHLIHINSIKAKIEDFQNELSEYELLKNGGLSKVSFSIVNIHEIFIKARIAKGWSQAELASALKIREQQIQRYESLNYSTASISKLKKISDVLGIKFFPLTAQIKQPEFDLGDDITSEQICIAQKKLVNKRNILIT